ncbi:riboflavin synthase [Fodinisporobacter ferrooxydans]|uniref:Riboflavin synthase n=1 Tax=Fodinisporobacter ferrooxydans TaxID=2901836 RepID=A0ABY4CR00_9BACL|nr:riboflavin synthase [Alicyclobacillaceae bacterium MYW30-H2]
MFTGIIEEIGKIRGIRSNGKGQRLQIAAMQVLSDVRLGDSIAVNGVCLTVTDFGTDWFSADVVPETMRRTNLHLLHTGSQVNLERAMSLSGRFGGHIVSGHIDGVGTIRTLEKEDNAYVLTIAVASNVLKYIVEKGSVCINGISLTVMQVSADAFQVSLIPHTRGITTAGEFQTGDLVNIECDVLGKYVERLLFYNREDEKKSIQKTDLTLAFLRDHGFA